MSRILSTGGGLYPSIYLGNHRSHDTPLPLGRHPPGQSPLSWKTPPPGRVPWADTAPFGYYGIWSTSGRYASYLNAFLLFMFLPFFQNSGTSCIHFRRTYPPCGNLCIRSSPLVGGLSWRGGDKELITKFSHFRLKMTNFSPTPKWNF